MSSRPSGRPDRPNGAGKTTLFNCLSRLYTPNAATILFEGKSILGRPRHDIPQIGIGRTFQNVALFDRMSVLDNVKVGCHSRSSTSFLRQCPAPAQGRARGKAHRREGRQPDRLHGPHPVHECVGRRLTFPIRKRVELARALASSPKLLLLDEPAAGLNHEEIEVLKGQIKRVRDTQNVTVLLVEHHMSLVMSVSTRWSPSTSARRSPMARRRKLQRDPEVIRAYLGPRDGGVVGSERLEGVLRPDAVAVRCRLRYPCRWDSRPCWAPMEQARRRRSGDLQHGTHRGGIRFDGKDLVGMPTEEIVRLRIAHVPEGRGTFTTLTVDEKLAHRRLHAPGQGGRPGRS